MGLVRRYFEVICDKLLRDALNNWEFGDEFFLLVAVKFTKHDADFIGAVVMLYPNSYPDAGGVYANMRCK